ncbi:MAG: hypothetical protein H6658_03865 [Ardenticatenaceae bacterium]|nr:hypothetical protein [Ardenticatenaceae bacterium]
MGKPLSFDMGGVAAGDWVLPVGHPANLTLVKNCSIVGVYWGAYAWKQPHTLFQSMQTLLGWYSQGKLKPHISATYPL